MTRRPVRIANFSGYLGDRASALDEVMAGDPVDVLMGDYLAEVTVAALAARHRQHADLGFAEPFLTQVRPHLAQIVRRGVKVVTNAGGFHPAGLAAALRAAGAEDGVPLAVAHVDGDDLLPRLAELQAGGAELQNLDSGAPLASWGVAPIAASAYLGGWGIAAALAAGADVVVCGRVTDASLTAGPAAWWHGWAPDDWDALAGAVAAGHVVECGPHATGGNFSGFTSIPGVEHPGYPIAEVAADGSSVITKHTGAGGAVTVDTVTAQLLYEIQGPRYANPDVTVHLDTVRLSLVGPDRVQLSGVRGSPPPPTTKVAVFAPIGWQTVQMVFVTAPDVEPKVELLRRQLLAAADPGIEQLDVTRLGQVPVDPANQWEATVPVRVMATARSREALAGFAGLLHSLYLSSFPGFFHDGGSMRITAPHPRVDYWPALLDTALVEHRVTLPDGAVRDVRQPPVGGAVVQPVHPEPAPLAPTGDEVRRPLGDLVHARSGDKGGNSNLGLWVGDDAAWPWLQAAMSTDALRRLLPELKELDVVRHELAHLRAVHFVLRGLLGTGGSSNLRVDQVGKAVGEYVRARHVPIPAALLRGPTQAQS